MAITYQCECGKRLVFPDGRAGQRSRCPSCLALFAVPAAPSREQGVDVTCPSCGRQGNVPASFRGKGIVCKGCGATFKPWTAVPKGAPAQQSSPQPRAIPPLPSSSDDPLELIKIDLDDDFGSSNARRSSPHFVLVGIVIGILALVGVIMLGKVSREKRNAGRPAPQQVANAPAGNDPMGAINAGENRELSFTSLATFLSIIIVTLSFYLLPTIIASSRKHQNTAAIAALNILLGCTFLGWVAALVWALTEVRTRDHFHYHDHRK